MYNVTSSWAEGTITWNVQPTVSGEYFGTITHVESNRPKWVSLVMTDTVKGWYDSSLTNNGILLAQIDVYYSNGYNKQFASREDSTYYPYLSVNYTGSTIPPVPVISNVMTGNFYINTSWTAGTGNITDSYNSTNGTTWVNNTATSRNTTLSAHAWQNLTIYAYNNTAGILNITPLINNTRIPNNAISISNVSSSYSITEGQQLYIDANFVDADSDTGTFNRNFTYGSFSTVTGVLTWTPTINDDGTYNWLINVTDGYGSTSTTTFVVTVLPSPPNSLTFTSTRLNNFNWTWVSNAGINTFNVSHNGTWTNGSLTTFINLTVINYTNISVYGYNTTYNLLSTNISSNIQIVSPLDSSAITMTVPPYSAVFTWVNFTPSANGYNLLLSQHSDFSDTIADKEVDTNSTTISLFIEGTYYWKVRDRTGSTYGTWSPTFQFTLSSSTSPSSDGSTGVQGIVYEQKSSGYVVVSGTRVTISNSTWSSSTITDSTGYFLFKNLTNQTNYNLIATKQNYLDSNTELVTTINGTWVSKNIFLIPCVSGFNCFYNQKYVQFVIQSPLGDTYNGVAVTVYKGSETTATYTGTTDTAGAITFLLITDQSYRITFIKSAQSINEEITIYPRDEQYVIYVWASKIVDRSDNISWVLDTLDNNATTTYLRLTYNSNTTTTTGNFWVKNATGVLLYSTTASSFTSWSPSFAVNDSNNMAYTWGFNVTHPTWGLVKQSDTIRFKSQFLIDLKISDTRIYTWISIGFLILLSSLFSYTTNKYGYVLIPLFALFTWGIGWFPQGYSTTHFTIIMTTVILGALAFIRTAEKKGGYPY